MSYNQRRRSATKVSAPDAPRVRQLTSLVTMVVVVCALALGRVVLVPVALAVVLCFLVAPLVDVLRGFRLARIPSVVVAVVLGLTLMCGIGTLIGSQILQLAAGLPQYQTVLAKKIALAQDAVTGRTFNLVSSASSLFTRATDAITDSGSVAMGPAPSVDKAPVLVAAQEMPPSPLELTQALLSQLARLIVTSAIVMIVAIFMLLQREDLRDRLIRLSGTRDLRSSTTAMDEAARWLSRYFLAQFGVNLGVGLVIYVGLEILGIPGALLAGLLTALLRLIPYVGTWIGAAIALTLAATDPGWSMLIWTLVLFGATDLIAAQVIEPRLFGKDAHLSPVAAIVGALFWGWIWGPVGLVLSTPITLSLVILGRHVKKLAFLEVLLGAQAPLPAPANFYQRMLAGDSGEVLEQAEYLLKSMSPVDYYDTVVLQGLLLVHRDMTRGAILPEQVVRLNEALTDFIDALVHLLPPVGIAAPRNSGTGPSQRIPGTPSVTPATGSTSRSVSPVEGGMLCIAGHGRLDAPLAAATVHLLRREGILAEYVRYDQFSRQQPISVDLTRIPTICVVSFDAEQSPRYIRVLFRELHRHAPAAALILGFACDAAEATQVRCGAPVMMASSFKTLLALDSFKPEPGAHAGLHQTDAPSEW